MIAIPRSGPVWPRGPSTVLEWATTRRQELRMGLFRARRVLRVPFYNFKSLTGCETEHDPEIILILAQNHKLVASSPTRKSGSATRTWSAGVRKGYRSLYETRSGQPEHVADAHRMVIKHMRAPPWRSGNTSRMVSSIKKQYKSLHETRSGQPEHVTDAHIMVGNSMRTPARWAKNMPSMVSALNKHYESLHKARSD